MKTMIIAMAMAISMGAYAQEANKSVVAPPWMTHTDHIFYLLYAVDTDEVQKHLPDGLSAKTNEEGKTTVGLEFYSVDKAFGQPTETIFFVFAEVEGQNSSSGTPGHYPFYGLVQSPEAQQAWKAGFSYEYGLAPDMEQTISDGVYAGQLVFNGQEILSYKGKPVDADAYHMQSNVNMVTVTDEGKVMRSEIPFINYGRNFEIEEFKFDSQGIEQLKLLDGQTPFLYYMVQDAHFSYTAPKS